MCGPVGAAVAIGGLVGGSIYSANKKAKMQKRAIASNEASAAREAQRAETAFNKANQKMPDLAAIMDRNKRGAAGGVGSTFLTGTMGSQPSLLGRTSLLGG